MLLNKPLTQSDRMEKTIFLNKITEIFIKLKDTTNETRCWRALINERPSPTNVTYGTRFLPQNLAFCDAVLKACQIAKNILLPDSDVSVEIRSLVLMSPTEETTPVRQQLENLACRKRQLHLPAGLRACSGFQRNKGLPRPLSPAISSLHR